jgi:hypothetical protein
MQIWNEINIQKDKLKDEFLSGKTLSDLAEEYHCSAVTIKRKLKSIGVDTSIHNHSQIAIQKHRNKVCKDTKELTKEFLHKAYIQENKDTKTIAEELGIHYSSVRKYVQLYKLQKNNDQLVGAWQSRYKAKHGCIHPSQHRSVYSRSLNKVRYVSISGKEYYFKSMMELTIALLLDYSDKTWDYEVMRIPYMNHITGKKSYYLIDFTTDKEWIEVKPAESMIPSDKRLYADAAAKKIGFTFRGCTDVERAKGWELLLSGFKSEAYSFVHQTPSSSCKQITYYFKSMNDLETYTYPNGFKYHYRACVAPTIFKLVLRRNCGTN